MKTRILLTFDLEEFDLPFEYGSPISEEDQMSTSIEGLQRLIELLSRQNITATFFTTAFYAIKNKELIRELAENHEIASHSFSHSEFRKTDVSDSKSEIEKITGKTVYGFRMPHFKKIDLSLIRAAGYSYDSSINPTYIPGRYNNFFSKRKIFKDSKSTLIELPVSVSPIIRFPLFWLSFKNVPLSLYYYMCKATMKNDSYLVLCFHPWEFAELDSFIIPRYIKSLSGSRLTDRLEKLIIKLKEEGNFSTISSFLSDAGYLGSNFFS